jgi:hypothetical protein
VVEANPFPSWLAEVAADAVVVHADDITAEARGNLWTFGLDEDQRAAVSPADIEEFVRLVAAARGQWLAERGGVLDAVLLLARRPSWPATVQPRIGRTSTAALRVPSRSGRRARRCRP